MEDLKSLAILFRWLGPWADEEQAPPSLREDLFIPNGNEPDLKIWVYKPTRGPIRGAYLIGPGLHFKGAQHPKLDRFARILARGGNLVFSPFISDYENLQIRPETYAPFKRAFQALKNHPEVPRNTKPGLFSISFGCWLTLQLASDPDIAHDVGACLVFGGYGDFEEAVHFATTGKLFGEKAIHFDPLGLPVVFLQFVDAVQNQPPNNAPLIAAWKEYVYQTWDQGDEMKKYGKNIPIAHNLLKKLPLDCQELFLIGCGLHENSEQIVIETLERFDSSHFELRPRFRHIQCPTFIFHGTDDDVIPYTQAQILTDALPTHIHKETYLTGLYGHSTQEKRSFWTLAKDLSKELKTMVKMLDLLNRGGRF